MANQAFHEQCLTRIEAAEVIGKRLRGKAYHWRTLAIWEGTGYGPPIVKIGRNVFYPISALDRWFEMLVQQAVDNTAVAKATANKREAA
jgi:hypothetical protein